MPSLLFAEIIAHQGLYPLLWYKAQKSNLNFQFNKIKEIRTPSTVYSVLVASPHPGRMWHKERSELAHSSGTAASGISGWPGQGLWTLASWLQEGGESVGAGAPAWIGVEFVEVLIWLPLFSDDLEKQSQVLKRGMGTCGLQWGAEAWKNSQCGWKSEWTSNGSHWCSRSWLDSDQSAWLYFSLAPFSSQCIGTEQAETWF